MLSSVTYPFLVGLDEDSEGLDLGLTSSVGEARQAVGSSPGLHPQNITRPDPNLIARQISDGIQKMSEGGIELRLSPEELGSVRMQFVQTEQGLNVHIVADRSETLDLIRRHIDQLAKDLADSGFDATGFTFGDDGGQHEQKSSNSSRKDGPSDEQPLKEQPVSVVYDGLDIRV